MAFVLTFIPPKKLALKNASKVKMGSFAAAAEAKGIVVKGNEYHVGLQNILKMTVMDYNIVEVRGLVFGRDAFTIVPPTFFSVSGLAWSCHRKCMEPGERPL